MTKTIIGALWAATLVLAGCGEQAQTASARKSDGKPWDSTSGAYMAEGWKAGDKTAWEQQMRQRAQAQNEYARTSAQPQ